MFFVFYVQTLKIGENVTLVCHLAQYFVCMQTLEERKKMILFGFLALIMLMWTLNINNQLRMLRSSTEELKTEIEEAAQSCGQSMN